MSNIFGSFPNSRPRRLRGAPWIRDLFSEIKVSNQDFIKPFFVIEGVNKKEPILTLCDNYRFSINLLVEEVKKVRDLGVTAIMLFPVIEQGLKDSLGNEAIMKIIYFREQFLLLKKKFLILVF